MYTNRTSTSSMYNLLAANVKNSEANYNRLTAQLAANSKLTSITDDPIAAVNIINTNRQISQIGTFQQNVGLAMSELSTLDDILELTSGYLSTAWNKAMQANNGTYGVNSLKALKTEIDEITKTMVDLGNTEFNDNYIFAGANTKLSPYEIEENGDITYRGTPADNPNYARRTEVADGVYETVNVTGDKIFGYYKAATDDDPEEAEGILGVMKVLSNSIQEVIDAREAGDKTAEETALTKLNGTLDGFDKSLKNITTTQSKFGGVYNRLEMSDSTLDTTNENLTSYLSELQDLDYAKAISDWYQAQYAYQASLQVTSRAMQGLSLLNYM